MNDGWYIDLDTRISCDPHYPSTSGHAFLSVSSGKPEIPEFKDIGKRETGYPMELTSTTTIPPNRKIQGRTSLVEDKIIELSTTPLDPSLFEVPPDFKKVDRIARDPEPPLLIKLLRAWAYWKYRLLNLFR